MLQIITEKFFPPGERYVTPHRAVFYTNYRANRSGTFTTCVGTLTPSTDHLPLATFFCEMVEKQEKYPDGPKPGVLVSTGGDELLNDFAAVVAFFLNITCTPDHGLTRRLLLSERPSLGVEAIPSRFISRMFDARVEEAPDDAAALDTFLTKLVGLERKSFVGAMQAIRQFITGMHRISDDLSLAYTLLVTSIEALAQEFDGHIASWPDYEQRKRMRIDDALTGASDHTARRVREAILANEHVAASRRFRDFTLGHVAPSFFRQDARAIARPISRPDLVAALRSAYEIRSRYVHSLHDIPRQLTLPDRAETVDGDGRICLSFAGLARLARHVILQFINRQPTVARESFDYRMDLPGVVRMQLSSEYWIASPAGFDHRSARRRLGALLGQISDAILMRIPGAAITDMRPVLHVVEQQLPGLRKPAQRLPMLALYVLFNKIAPPDSRSADWPAFIEPYQPDFDIPALENLLVRMIVGAPLPWSIEALDKIRDDHFSSRHTANAVPIGRLLESALILVVAEAYRANGNIDRAAELVSLAVETHPGYPQLSRFEETWTASGTPEIDWTAVLLPPAPAIEQHSV
ncbi:MAG: hypothetical protein NW217_13295 [Hyphomicrobiaceae bacterium]|nr:hypothetical protein [Hyphomicrobiaceae bacterium]